MRILVTGATGFIGSHVVRILIEQGHDVHAIIRGTASPSRISDVLSKIKVVRVDLRNADQTRAAVLDVHPECAVHMAWYAVPGKYWTSPKNLDCTAMSLSLAVALAEAGCRHLVSAGTCAEYDWDYGFLSEVVTPLRPATLYGVCKDSTRRILESYCARTSMGFAWARFFFLYGPYEPVDRLVSSVIVSLLHGKEALCSQGNQIRDFLHVTDAASAVVRMLGDDAHGPYNVASGTPASVKDVIRRIADKLGRPDLVRLGAREESAVEVPFIVGDRRRLDGELGWHPRFDLDSGLDDAIDWWRARSST